MAQTAPAPIALTMGEPAGIGGEIALKAWAWRHAETVPPFCLMDDPDRIARLARAIDLEIQIAVIETPAAALDCFDRALPVLPLSRPPAGRPGTPSLDDAGLILEAIERAVAMARAGAVRALVTNPVNKNQLYQAGFRHPGQTEFLAELCGGAARPVMMLVARALRVVPVTIHLGLRDVAAALSEDLITECGGIVNRSLIADFGIDRPRIAVAALNPHAGEGGALGDEERTIIAPAVARLKAAGVAAFGPRPADTLFHAAAREGHDAVLCMYHDQALIPLKTIAFDSGVNTTLGLPVVRTSPDHGTAFDIAGRGTANPASLIAALRLAGEIADQRQAAPGHVAAD